MIQMGVDSIHTKIQIIDVIDHFYTAVTPHNCTTAVVDADGVHRPAQRTTETDTTRMEALDGCTRSRP